MTYKSNETFGTSCGGICSIIARFISFTYIGVVLFGFYYNVNYNVESYERYLPIVDPTIYKV